MVLDTLNGQKLSNSIPKLYYRRKKSNAKVIIDIFTGEEIKKGEPYFQWGPREAKTVKYFSRYRPPELFLRLEYDPKRKPGDPLPEGIIYRH